MVEGGGFQAAISPGEEIQSANITKIRADVGKTSTHQEIIDLKDRLDNEVKFSFTKFPPLGWLSRARVCVSNSPPICATRTHNR